MTATMHDGHGDDSENFLELLNSRSLAPELFADPPPPPSCDDYLKKMEYGAGAGGGVSWSTSDHHHHHQFAAAAAAAAMEKHMASSYGGGAPVAAAERLTANLSDLVSNWSLAPPSPSCIAGAATTAACDNHGGGGEFLRPMGSSSSYSSMLGLSSRMYVGGGTAANAMDVPWGSNAGAARSLSDLISFGGGGAMAAEKPAAVAPASSPAARTSSSSADYKKQQEISSPAKTSSSGGGKEGKKKRSEQESGGSEGSTKKSKHEATSPTSSLKSQVPKVKLGDKITALQQIVSPFGKTDTASVLYEAINYIKWLHEQVQLLSDPYMKSSSSKDYNAWGGLDRKEKADADVDLRSRGLCLVPVSCTPQVYRDNNGPDYWTPPYRSCLYR
uniref:BHLH domain-containing protein n=1 Tax=Leersia perrieri TaxID=77586 RepID=A0A0D9WYP3_9ORYZ